MIRRAGSLRVLAVASALLAGMLAPTLIASPAQSSTPAQEWFIAQAGTPSFGNGTSCAAPDAVGSDDTAIRVVLDAVTADDTITICDGVYNVTSTLIVDDSITIQGESTAGSILDGGGAVQIMRVNDDDSTAGDPLEVEVLVTDLTFRNGNTGNNGTDNCNTKSQCGGAIYVEHQSNLTVLRSYFIGNYASFFGGAISNAGQNGVGGVVRIETSTFQNNSSQVDAGAFGVVGSNGAGVRIANNTFVGNAALGRDGGSVNINFSDSVTLIANTFMDDRAAGQGQSVYANASMGMQGNLIAPSGSGNPCALVGGGVTDSGSVSTGSGCKTAQIVTRDSLNLRGLGNWGGPTPTVWIGPGSSAVDANTGTCQALDQRGATRSAAPCDAGAYERRGPTDEGTTGTLDYTSPLQADETTLPTSSPTPSPAVTGRTIGYMSLSADVCSAHSASGVVTPASTGTCEIQWYLAPTLTADGAAADDTITITKATQEPLAIDPIAQPVVFGTTVSMTTTGGSGTGSIVFTAFGSTGCFVPWWFDPTLLIVADASGTCTVTAEKAGDSVYDPAISAPVSITLAKATQSPLTIQAPASLVIGSATTLSTTGGSSGQAIAYAATPSDVCRVSGDQLRMLGRGTCTISATMPGDGNYLPVSAPTVRVESADPPPPDPTKAPSAPLDAAARWTGASVEITWQEPSRSGEYPISTYQVVSQPSGGTCLALAPTLTCRISGLAKGVTYTFAVRALNGITWGNFSEPSNPVTIPRESERSILITGSREGRRLEISGSTTGFGAGAVLRPWIRLMGQSEFTRGSARILVDDSGVFTWGRRAGRVVEVYVAAADGSVTSNPLPIRPRKGQQR